ncbi:MAG TPA: hypothetical protein V6D48_14100, partial [Oculatellaceae cyanobacterium]
MFRPDLEGFFCTIISKEAAVVTCSVSTSASFIPSPSEWSDASFEENQEFTNCLQKLTKLDTGSTALLNPEISGEGMNESLKVGRWVLLSFHLNS